MSVSSNLKNAIDNAIKAANRLTKCRRLNPTFHQVWDAAPKIEFNPAWDNGTDYYNGAASGPNAPVLAVGAEWAAISPMPNNRKLILVGLPEGNMVLFQRFSTDDGVIASNVPFSASEEIKRACASYVDDENVKLALTLANDLFRAQLNG